MFNSFIAGVVAPIITLAGAFFIFVAICCFVMGGAGGGLLFLVLAIACFFFAGFLSYLSRQTVRVRR